MIQKTAETYLRHMLESIEAIDVYVSGIESFEHFVQSKLHEDAVIRRLQVMAESMLRLPEDVREAMPEIPWHAVKNFRNLLVHEYLEIDIHIVWNLIHKDLPLLRAAILRVLEKHP